MKPEAAFKNVTSQLVPSVSPDETLLPARLLTSTMACGQSSLRRLSELWTSTAPRMASSMKVPTITFTNGIRMLGGDAVEEHVVHVGDGEIAAVAERPDVAQRPAAGVVHHVADLRLAGVPGRLIFSASSQLSAARRLSARTFSIWAWKTAACFQRASPFALIRAR